MSVVSSSPQRTRNVQRMHTSTLGMPTQNFMQPGSKAKALVAREPHQWSLCVWGGGSPQACRLDTKEGMWSSQPSLHWLLVAAAMWHYEPLAGGWLGGVFACPW